MIDIILKVIMIIQMDMIMVDTIMVVVMEVEIMVEVVMLEVEVVNQKNDILLKGLINQHEEQCIDEDCPLKKFLENSGNYNIQKLCLLNYMNNYFTFGIKQFPESRELLIAYIQFNYSKKFNLNAVRTHLGKIQIFPKILHII